MSPHPSSTWRHDGPGLYVGNAHSDAQDHRGWLIGHFLGDSDGVRSSHAVEVKWGVHPAGEGRDSWVTDEQRTTLLLLVSGRFHVDLSVGSFTLEDEGDYAMWGARDRPLLAGREGYGGDHRPLAVGL